MQAAPEPSDEEIVRLVLDGDASAAAILFDRHLPKLRADARRGIPAKLRAKVGESDVVQEAYLRAYLTLGSFEDRGDGSFARWLRGILGNRIAYEVRRHLAAGKRDARREVRLRSTTRHFDPPARGPSPSAVVVAAEQSGALRQVIESLPDDYRTVIQLVHMEGLTLVEAGERLDRSADAARMLYSRALARLSERLGGAKDSDG